MLAWIGTRLFYAILFFALGAWAATGSPGMNDIMRDAKATAYHSFEKLGAWTSSTLASISQTEKAREAAPATTSSTSAPTAAAPTPAEAPAPAGQKSDQQLLDDARAAYARHDVLSSINAYRGYIDGNPDAVEARGELGNVYFANGRLRDAAQAYFEAAMLRLKAGDVAGAQAFLGAVRKGDGALGDDLKREIAKAETAKM